MEKGDKNVIPEVFSSRQIDRMRGIPPTALGPLSVKNLKLPPPMKNPQPPLEE
jgi:hypothetical protein